MTSTTDTKKSDDVRSALERLLDLIAARIAEQLAAGLPLFERRVNNASFDPDSPSQRRMRK
jgi:hypothetical protein